MFNLFKNGSPGQIMETLHFIAHGGGSCEDSYNNEHGGESIVVMERVAVIDSNDEGPEYVEECNGPVRGPVKGPVKTPNFDFDFEVDMDAVFPTNSIVSGTFLGGFGTGDNLLYTALFGPPYESEDFSGIYESFDMN
ncbi:MAG: hypothetical protein AAFQ81_00195 [Pseudomonadota bacterium]